MKKILSVLLVLSLLFALTACGEKQEEKPVEPEQEQSETVDPTPSEEEKEEEAPAYEAVPEVLAGDYHEEIAGRGMLTLQIDAQGVGEVNIHWPSSAASAVEWNMHVQYDPQKNELVYEDAKCVEYTYESEDSSTEEVLYEDGKGVFQVGEDALVWVPENKELNDGGPFVRNIYGEVYTETENLNEAIEGSGIDVDFPVEEALPGNVALWKYQYTDGIIKALYESVDNELIISKSNRLSGAELAEDPVAYEEEWVQSIKGLSANCCGKDGLANLVWFSMGDQNFTISYNKGYPEVGLTADEIVSLAMSMQ